ncbi:MAG: hypothetical protein ABIV13_06970, partial [Fimbriimonadales bacterium]
TDLAVDHLPTDIHLEFSGKRSSHHHPCSLAENNVSKKMGAVQLVISNPPHIKEFPFFVSFKVTCDAQWPSDADFDRFDAIQARMDSLIYEWEFCNVGMFTLAGTREWLIYAKDGRGLIES